MVLTQDFEGDVKGTLRRDSVAIGEISPDAPSLTGIKGCIIVHPLMVSWVT